MSHRVVFSDEADANLRDIGHYIAKKKSTRIAEEYLTRIILACNDLRTLPHRGTKRDDLLTGLRTIGFERSVTIAFRVLGETIDIVAIFYGGRSLELYFQSRSFPPQ
jgi:toxin ParE1/3/4